MPTNIASIETRRKIIYMRSVRLLSYRQISCSLIEEDGQRVSKSAVGTWLKKTKGNGTEYVLSNRRPRNARKAVVNDDVLRIIDECMKSNPELSSTDLQKSLLLRTNIQLSSSYIRKLRARLGWTYKKTKYCQLVRDVNKPKRLYWARTQLANGKNFDDVIFSDEASFEAQRTVGHMYYKKGEPTPLRPKPKHPIKVGRFLTCTCGIHKEGKR